tara:strand:+ start:12 stop:179 length:168 start_codon:yes stop_codon:yes gene_type:complete
MKDNTEHITDIMKMISKGEKEKMTSEQISVSIRLLKSLGQTPEIKSLIQKLQQMM